MAPGTEDFVSENSTRFVTTADGRTLAFEEYGDPSGTPVFLLSTSPDRDDTVTVRDPFVDR